MPLLLRSSKSRLAYSSVLAEVAGSMIVALSMFFRPSFAARALISPSFPMRMMSAMSSAKALSAAVIVRSSRLSGRTMRCLFAFARATI